MFASPRSGFSAPAAQTFDSVESFRDASEKVEAAFDISMTLRVFGETRSVVGLSKGNAVRMAIRFSCGGKAAYDRDRWSLSIFKTPVLFGSVEKVGVSAPTRSCRTIAMFCFSPPDTPPFLLPSIAAAPFSAAAIILSNPNMASIRFSLSASKSSESSVRLSRIVPPQQ